MNTERDLLRRLTEVERRLAHIESQFLGRAAAHHPSADQFGVGEAVSDRTVSFGREKICDLEPGNRPCDHCAMCSARGF